MAEAARDLPKLINFRAQIANLLCFFVVQRRRRQSRLWIKLGIICAAIVRQRKTYSQKFSRILNFLIAGVIEFSQASDGTRKRRIAEYFGSLGWTSVHPRELRESGGRRSRCAQSAGDCLPQGAPIVRRRSPPVRARSYGKRPGWGLGVF